MRVVASTLANTNVPTRIRFVSVQWLCRRMISYPSHANVALSCVSIGDGYTHAPLQIHPPQSTWTAVFVSIYMFIMIISILQISRREVVLPHRCPCRETQALDYCMRKWGWVEGSLPGWLSTPCQHAVPIAHIPLRHLLHTFWSQVQTRVGGIAWPEGWGGGGHGAAP